MKGIQESIPPDCRTRAMLAEEVDRSVTVIKRMEKEGKISPSKNMHFGKITVGLYTDSDLREVRKVLDDRVPGRPRKSSPVRKTAAHRVLPRAATRQARGKRR